MATQSSTPPAQGQTTVIVIEIHEPASTSQWKKRSLRSPSTDREATKTNRAHEMMDKIVCMHRKCATPSVYGEHKLVQWGIADSARFGTRRRGEPEQPGIGQDPAGADLDEPILLEFHRYGTKQLTPKNRQAAATDITVQPRTAQSISSDSDVNVVCCKQGEPAKGACGHQVSLAESRPANTDAVARIRQSADICSAASTCGMTMTRKPTATLSVAEMYARGNGPPLAERRERGAWSPRPRSSAERKSGNEGLPGRNARDRNSIVSLSAYNPQDPSWTTATQIPAFTQPAVMYAHQNRQHHPELHPGATNPEGRDPVARSRLQRNTPKRRARVVSTRTIEMTRAAPIHVSQSLDVTADPIRSDGAKVNESEQGTRAAGEPSVSGAAPVPYDSPVHVDSLQALARGFGIDIVEGPSDAPGGGGLDMPTLDDEADSLIHEFVQADRSTDRRCGRGARLGHRTWSRV
ncbi:hypothetical protein QAD02_003706 [Eretmocerus hayati]|uniref:Uncharacterized protein n=1 Tax=Eretmocerus hayati TaxID=131215 RepID=A0ACC2NQC4_9HYME|nr:hypothetical protein QAD02_003706 [Eretmocerus hayati]